MVMKAMKPPHNAPERETTDLRPKPKPLILHNISNIRHLISTTLTVSSIEEIKPSHGSGKEHKHNNDHNSDHELSASSSSLPKEITRPSPCLKQPENSTLTRRHSCIDDDRIKTKDIENRNFKLTMPHNEETDSGSLNHAPKTLSPHTANIEVHAGVTSKPIRRRSVQFVENSVNYEKPISNERSNSVKGTPILKLRSVPHHYEGESFTQTPTPPPFMNVVGTGIDGKAGTSEGFDQPDSFPSPRTQRSHSHSGQGHGHEGTMLGTSDDFKYHFLHSFSEFKRQLTEIPMRRHGVESKVSENHNRDHSNNSTISPLVDHRTSSSLPLPHSEHTSRSWHALSSFFSITNSAGILGQTSKGQNNKKEKKEGKLLPQIATPKWSNKNEKAAIDVMQKKRLRIYTDKLFAIAEENKKHLIGLSLRKEWVTKETTLLMQRHCNHRDCNMRQINVALRMADQAFLTTERYADAVYSFIQKQHLHVARSALATFGDVDDLRVLWECLSENSDNCITRANEDIRVVMKTLFGLVHVLEKHQKFILFSSEYVGQGRRVSMPTARPAVSLTNPDITQMIPPAAALNHRDHAHIFKHDRRHTDENQSRSPNERPQRSHSTPPTLARHTMEDPYILRNVPETVPEGRKFIVYKKNESGDIEAVAAK